MTWPVLWHLHWSRTPCHFPLESLPVDWRITEHHPKGCSLDLHHHTGRVEKLCSVHCVFAKEGKAAGWEELQCRQRLLQRHQRIYGTVMWEGGMRMFQPLVCVGSGHAWGFCNRIVTPPGPFPLHWIVCSCLCAFKQFCNEVLVYWKSLRSSGNAQSKVSAKAKCWHVFQKPLKMINFSLNMLYCLALEQQQILC